MITKEEFLKECEKNLSVPLVNSKKYSKLAIMTILTYFVSLVSVISFLIVSFYIRHNFTLSFLAFLVLAIFCYFTNSYANKLKKSMGKVCEIALSYLGFSLGNENFFDHQFIQSSGILSFKEKSSQVFEKKEVAIASFIDHSGDHISYALAFSIPYQSKVEALIKNNLASHSCYDLEKVAPLFSSSFFENNSVFMRNPDEAKHLLTYDFVKKMEQVLSVLNNLKNPYKKSVEILVCNNQIIFCLSTRYDVFDLSLETAYLERYFSFFNKKKSLNLSKEFDELYETIGVIEKLERILRW